MSDAATKLSVFALSTVRRAERGLGVRVELVRRLVRGRDRDERAREGALRARQHERRGDQATAC